jgi:uncharacterized membrane protein YphA (DoxX/SURF4 family)
MVTIIKIFRLWNKFWFEPVSPTPVCVFRILFGLLVLLDVFFLLPDFLNWFGGKGILPMSVIGPWVERSAWSLFLIVPQNDGITIAALVVYIIAILCVIVGFHTRFSTFIVWLLMLSFHYRNNYYWYSADVVLRLYAMALLLTPSGARFSIDAWRKIKEDKNYPNKLYEPWAQRLIQVHIAAVYFKAFWGKLCYRNWWNGMAVYYATHIHWGYWTRYPLPYVLDHLWTVRLLTWGTLAIECSLWSLVWFKEFRYWVLLAGLILHAGIHWCLNLDTLEIAIVIGYINFVYPDDLERVLFRIKRTLYLFLPHSTKVKT